MRISMITLFLLTLWSCNDAKIEQETNKFKVVNLTNFNLESVHVFSVPLGDLLSTKVSDIYELNFSIESDDPIISFESENTVFVKYLFPDSTKILNTIIVDSLNFRTMSAYVHIE